MKQVVEPSSENAVEQVLETSFEQVTFNDTPTEGSESVPTTAPETLPENPAETVYTAIAGRVRGDSETHSRLTHIEDLGPLFPDLSPEQIMAHLGDMVKLELYQDVEVLVLPSGAGYLYSDTFIAPEDAEQKSLAEEVTLKITNKVREDSKERIQLTPVASLIELIPHLDRTQIEANLSTLTGDERYQDIHSLKGPTDIAYLYSDMHMTGNYANLLARVAAKDPTTTIAETVREESRVYPRPTKVALFYAPVFEINPDDMEATIERVLQKPDNKDLRKIVAPTGAVYLYSDRYMSPPQAEQWVQWEEVDRLNNP